MHRFAPKCVLPTACVARKSARGKRMRAMRNRARGGLLHCSVENGKRGEREDGCSYGEMNKSWGGFRCEVWAARCF